MLLSQNTLLILLLKKHKRYIVKSSAEYNYPRIFKENKFLNYHNIIIFLNLKNRGNIFQNRNKNVIN